MIPKENNFAYIDGANLHEGVKSLGMLVSPNNKCSYLLRKQSVPLSYLDNQKNKLEAPYKKNPPTRTEPYKGL